MVVVDDVEVGAIARGNDAAIVEANGASRVAGLLADHIGKVELGAARAVARPVGQQRCREAAVADHANVGPTVRQSGDGVGIGDHLVDGVQRAFGVVEERHIEHAASVVAEHLVEGDLFGRNTQRGGAEGDGGLLGGLVVRQLGHQVHLPPGAGEAATAPLRIVGQERGAEVGIAQAGKLFRKRQSGNLPVQWKVRERIESQFEAEQHADRASGDLRLHRQTGGDRIIEGGQQDLIGLRRQSALGKCE